MSNGCICCTLREDLLLEMRKRAALLTAQIEFADVVVVNKIDRVDIARRDEMTGVIKALNPTAESVYTDHGKVPLSKALATGKFDMKKASVTLGWARELEGRHEPVGRWWAQQPDKSHWPPTGSSERNAIDQRWREPCGDRLNEVVFIGQKMDRAVIEAAWKACHLTFTETRKGMKAWAALSDPFPTWAVTPVLQKVPA